MTTERNSNVTRPVILAFVLGCLGGWVLSTLGGHGGAILGPPFSAMSLSGMPPDDDFSMMDDNDDSLHNDDDLSETGLPEAAHRRLGSNPFTKFKREISGLKNTVNDLESKVRDKTNEVTKWQGYYNNMKHWYEEKKRQYDAAASQVRNLNSQLSSVRSQLTSKTNQLNSATKSLSSVRSQLTSKTNQLNSATKSLSSVRSQLTSKTTQFTNLVKKVDDLPDKLYDEIVKPIEDSVMAAKQSLGDIDSVANSVAQSTADALRQLNFLPNNAEDLAAELGSTLLKFAKDNLCVPYDCVAGAAGLELTGIKLYESDRASLTTSVYPTTCMEIADVAFDFDKLGSFLTDIGEIVAPDKIFTEVEEWLTTEMGKILVPSGQIKINVDEIENLAGKIVNEVSNLGTRRQLAVITDNGEHQAVTMEEVSAMAYQKGLDRAQELYGEKIEQAFKERKLAENAMQYIGFDSLKIKFEQSFGQTFTLKTKDRMGYAGSVFDESMHQTQVIPVPGTAGMARMVLSGSMEASMPYAMSTEAESKVKYGYNVGATVTIDLVNLEIETETDISQEFTVNATGAVSAGMSLKFAASASMALCLGPGNNACITVVIDASQASGAGFDALAQFNLGVETEKKKLTTMYTDVLDYEENGQPECNAQASNAAGYWQYILEPSVKVGIQGPSCCIPEKDTLYKYDGKPIDLFGLDPIQSMCFDPTAFIEDLF